MSPPCSGVEQPETSFAPPPVEVRAQRPPLGFQLFGLVCGRRDLSFHRAPAVIRMSIALHPAVACGSAHTRMSLFQGVRDLPAIRQNRSLKLYANHRDRDEAIAVSLSEMRWETAGRGPSAHQSASWIDRDWRSASEADGVAGAASRAHHAARAAGDWPHLRTHPAVWLLREGWTRAKPPSRLSPIDAFLQSEPGRRLC
jgi:hypothetical protein